MRRLTALLAALLLLAFTGCAANPAQPESTSSPAQADETQADFQVESAYPLEYAKEFTVDECTGGTRLITIQNARYLVVPENSTVPNGLSEDITVLQKPNPEARCTKRRHAFRYECRKLVSAGSERSHGKR